MRRLAAKVVTLCTVEAGSGEIKGDDAQTSHDLSARDSL
jgi:hypothetical protein